MSKFALLTVVAVGIFHSPITEAVSWRPDLAGSYCSARFETQQCCRDRQDEACSVPLADTACYCDEFCYSGRADEHDDCCPDYWSHCLGIPVPSRPGRPRVLDIGDTYAFIDWTPSEQNGDYPVHEYIVQMSNHERNEWENIYYVAHDQSKSVISDMVRHTDIRPGREYEFRIVAYNKAGPSEPSETARVFFSHQSENVSQSEQEVVVPTQPGKPYLLNWGDNFIELQWEASEFTENTLLKEYLVEMIIPDQNNWIPVIQKRAEAGETLVTVFIEIPAVKRGDLYEFRVVAVNDAGYSAPSEAVTITIPEAIKFADSAESKVAPEKPKNVAVTHSTDGQVTIEWNAPENERTVPVNEYIIFIYDESAQSWVNAKSIPNVSGQIHYVENVNSPLFKIGHEYSIAVTAVNDYGYSNYSDITFRIAAI